MLTSDDYKMPCAYNIDSQLSYIERKFCEIIFAQVIAACLWDFYQTYVVVSQSYKLPNETEFESNISKISIMLDNDDSSLSICVKCANERMEYNNSLRCKFMR